MRTWTTWRRSDGADIERPRGRPGPRTCHPRVLLRVETGRAGAAPSPGPKRWEDAMALKKGSDRTGKDWTAAERARLGELAKGDTPTRLIAWTMGRSERAIYSKASEEGVSLNPPN